MPLTVRMSRLAVAVSPFRTTRSCLPGSSAGSAWWPWGRPGLPSSWCALGVERRDEWREPREFPPFVPQPSKRYPRPRTVTSIVGFEGVSSMRERMRLMCTSSVFVSPK